MAATVSIAESNTSSETVTASVTNLNIGSSDTVNLTPATYPMPGTGRSYQKWVRFNVSANGDSNTIDNLKVWISTGSNPQSNVTFRTNAAESGTYAGAETFDTTNGPQNTDEETALNYDNDMPTSEPTGPNVGIGGSLSGSITTTGYSDYIIIQGVAASATVGDSVTFTFAYDETA